MSPSVGFLCRISILVPENDKGWMLRPGAAGKRRETGVGREGKIPSGKGCHTRAVQHCIPAVMSQCAHMCIRLPSGSSTSNKHMLAEMSLLHPFLFDKIGKLWKLPWLIYKISLYLLLWQIFYQTNHVFNIYLTQQKEHNFIIKVNISILLRTLNRFCLYAHT